jgi:hypothetical protein
MGGGNRTIGLAPRDELYPKGMHQEHLLGGPVNERRLHQITTCQQLLWRRVQRSGFALFHTELKTIASSSAGADCYIQVRSEQATH